jgi:hypothetical protein
MRGGHQPYRKGPRHPGPALTGMLRGKPFHLPNPQDVPRAFQRKSRLLKALRKRR